MCNLGRNPKSILEAFVARRIIYDPSEETEITNVFTTVSAKQFTPKVNDLPEESLEEFLKKNVEECLEKLMKEP